MFHVNNDILIKFVNWFTKINKASFSSKMVKFTDIYSMIKIIDLYQEWKWPKNWTLRETIFYRGFIKNMNINGNRLSSVKEVGFKLIICNSTYATMFKFS